MSHRNAKERASNDVEPAGGETSIPMQLDSMCVDVLIEVFDRMDTLELLKICDISKRFRHIIVNHVVREKVIDFEKLSDYASAIKVLRVFGKSITRMKIDLYDMHYRRPKNSFFDELLTLIIEHMTVGSLVELEMTIGFGDEFNERTEQLLNQAIPFFQNVTSLRLKIDIFSIYYGDIRWDDRLLNVFPFKNVQTIEFHNIETAGDWLRSSSVKNLRNIRLIDTKIENFDNFKAFLEGKPDLKTFHTDSIDADEYFNAIARYVPNIEDIGTVRAATIDTADNNNTPPDNKRYLKLLRNLKRIEIESSCNNQLNNIFNDLASDKSLNTLKINLDYDEEIQQQISLKVHEKFTNLSNLHLTGVDSENIGPFLPSLLSHSLKTCFLSGRFLNQITIEQILQTMKNLRTLRIESNSLRVSKQFYLSLLEIRKQVQDKGTLRCPLVVYIFDDEPLDWRASIGEEYNERLIALKWV